jgi:hypothetical protein
VALDSTNVESVWFQSSMLIRPLCKYDFFSTKTIFLFDSFKK